jgi:hypothetical protein
MRPLDQEEGTIRARGREERSLPAYPSDGERLGYLLDATEAAGRRTRTATDIALIHALEDPAEIDRIVRLAHATGRAEIIEGVDVAAVQQLQRLERIAVKRRPNVVGDRTESTTLARVRARQATFRQEHPSVDDQITALQKVRARRRAAIHSVFDRVRQALQIDDRSRRQRGATGPVAPAPEPTPGELQMGRFRR